MSPTDSNDNAGHNGNNGQEGTNRQTPCAGPATQFVIALLPFFLHTEPNGSQFVRRHLECR